MVSLIVVAICFASFGFVVGTLYGKTVEQRAVAELLAIKRVTQADAEKVLGWIETRIGGSHGGNA